MSAMKDNNAKENKEIFRWGERHTQTFLIFLCMLIAYGLRVNLSVAIVAMTDKSSANENFIEFLWDESTKSTVLSSFFWGYPITQVLIGHVAQKYGAKYFLVGSLGICGVLTIMTPLIVVHGGAVTMCVNRMVQGMAQGAIFPTANVMLSKWAPLSEKARLSSIVFGGTHFGSFLLLPVSGLLASSAGGWPSVFHVSGTMAMLWVFVWCLMGANSPTEHKSIRQEEKEYILSSLGDVTSNKSLPTPWREIFCSLPMWTLIIVHLAQNWGFMILLTNMPSYLNHVLKFNIKSNGFLSALSYFLMWIFVTLSSWISNYINARGLMTKTNLRKMWNSFAHWGGALTLFILYFFDTTVVVALILVTTTIALNGGVITGFMTNHLDLAPNFAGTLLGITNSIASLTAILGPLLVGFMVPDSTNKDQWGTVFLYSSCIFFAGNLFYVLFGSAEVQPWNNFIKTNKAPIVQDERHVDVDRHVVLDVDL